MDPITLRKLVTLRLPVIKVLHRHYRGASSDSYEDAFSHALLKIATGEAEWDPEDVIGSMLKPAMTYVSKELTDRRQHKVTCEDPSGMDRMVHQSIDEQLDVILDCPPSRPPHLDYRLLDQRFRRSLSPLRKKLWDLRCNQTPPSDIPGIMERTPEWIASTEYCMRAAYASWSRSIRVLESIQPPTRKSATQQVYTLSCQGYTPKYIAMKIGITNRHVSVELFRLRHNYKTKVDA